MNLKGELQNMSIADLRAVCQDLRISCPATKSDIIKLLLDPLKNEYRMESKSKQAKKIQKLVRGYLNKKKKSAKKMQALVRGHLTRKKNICGICLENKDKNGKLVKKTKCGHLFHQSCLNRWLSINNTCPICRVDLTESQSTRNSRRNNNTNNSRSQAMNRMIHQGAIINHNRRVARRYDPLGNRRRQEQRERDAARLGVDPSSIPIHNYY